MRFRWFVFILFIIAIGLRCLNLGYEPLWLDEIYSLMVANVHVNPPQLPSSPMSAQQWFEQYSAWQTMDWSALIQMLSQNVHMPLYYVLLNPWLSWLGVGEVGLRSFSVVWSVTFLMPLVWLGFILGGKRLAIAALLLAAVSPFQLNYAQEGRMYTLALFWTALSALALWKLLYELPAKGNQSKALTLWGSMYSVSVVAGMFSHYIFVFQVMFHGLCWLRTEWVRWRNKGTPTNTTARYWLLGAWGVLFLLLLQWWPVYLAQKAQAVGNEHFSAGLLGPLRYLEAFIMEPLMLVAGNNHLVRTVMMPVASVGIVTGIWGAISAYRKKTMPPSDAENPTSTTWHHSAESWQFLWAWMWLPLLLQVVVDIIQQTHTVTIVRYSLLIAPAVYLLVSQGWLYGLAWLSRHLPSRIVATVQTLLVVVLIVVGVGAVWLPSPLRDKANFPFHPIVNAVVPHLRQGDVILVNGPIGAPASLAYYLRTERPDQPIVYWASDYPNQPNAPYPESIVNKQFKRVWWFSYRGNRKRGYYDIYYDVLVPKYSDNLKFPENIPIAHFRLFSK